MAEGLGDATALRSRLRDVSVSFGIPTYNEGRVLLPTLDCLWDGMTLLGLNEATIILSDSSASMDTVNLAMQWADAHAAMIQIDHGDHQRGKKEAYNVILDRATSDLLVFLDADVVIPDRSLVAMFRHLLEEPRPAVVLGLSVPNPSARALRFRAGSWGMRAQARYARSLGRGAARSAGPFSGWAKSFYSTYRYILGSGSIADDTELANAVMTRGVRVTSATDAIVLRMPVGTLRDFIYIHHRESVVFRGQRGTPEEWKAAAVEATVDPLGAVIWLTYFLLWKLFGSRLGLSDPAEAWEPVPSTRQ